MLKVSCGAYFFVLPYKINWPKILADSRWNPSTSQYVYTETTIGASGPTGTHNYEIQYAGSSAWNVYIDYTKVDFWTFSYTTAPINNVGIESNDDANSFTSGTYASAIEYQDTSGWHYRNRVLMVIVIR